MSSSKSATAPDLTLKPSGILRGYLIFVTVLSLSVLWSLSILDGYLQVALSGLILFCAWRAFVQHENVVFIKHKGDDRWLLGLQRDEEVKATLLNQFYVTPWVVVINFKSTPGKRFPVVLLSDRMDQEALRGMRVYLRQLSNNNEQE